MKGKSPKSPPFLQSLNNIHGMTLVEVVIATFIISLFSLGVSEISSILYKGNRTQTLSRTALAARAQIDAALKNSIAWQQTVLKNPSFACLQTPEGCSEAPTKDGYYDFIVYSTLPNEKLSYDAADPRTRLNQLGGACPANSDDLQCPLRFQAHWKPLCEKYPCSNPTLDVQVKLVVGKDAGLPFNGSTYELQSIRPVSDDATESSCQVLNGTFNVLTRTCYPKHSGKTCAAIGKPSQVVVAVHEDGTIECAPVYKGTCNATTEVMNGIDTKGQAICTPKVRPYNCPVACEGQWSACSKVCGGGTQSFTVTKPAAYGGAECPYKNGDVQSCNTQHCPVNCVGAWSACSQSCGGGTMTFWVTQPAAYGGAQCASNNGDSRSCNTQACPIPVDCGGYWNACDTNSGMQTFSVTQWPQNGGAACPAARTCRVDCVGSMSACNPPGAQTYTWSISPKNGGNACPYANGASIACAPQGKVVRTVTYHAGYSGGQGGSADVYAKVQCVTDSSQNGYQGGCYTDTSNQYSPGSGYYASPNYPCLIGERADLIGLSFGYASDAYVLPSMYGYAAPHTSYPYNNRPISLGASRSLPLCPVPTGAGGPEWGG